MASFLRHRLTFGQSSPPVKSKLDSIMARLDWLCSEDSDDALQDNSEHARWAKLFE